MSFRMNVVAAIATQRRRPSPETAARQLKHRLKE